jgi:hypothetical protein
LPNGFYPEPQRFDQGKEEDGPIQFARPFWFYMAAISLSLLDLLIFR